MNPDYRQDVSSEVIHTLEGWARAQGLSTLELKEKFIGLSPRDERVIPNILDRLMIACFMERIEAAWSTRNTVGANIHFKNDEKAKEFRLKADKDFAAKRFQDSLLGYSQAVRFAVFERTVSPEGNEFVRAYVSRSALLVRCEQWALALSDVKMALKYGCSSVDLERRKRLCEAKLAEEQEIASSEPADDKNKEIDAALAQLKIGPLLPPLSIPSSSSSKPSTSACTLTSAGVGALAALEVEEEEEPILEEVNPKMPAASIKVVETSYETKGRGLKLTDKVTFGEVLVKESPYAHTLFIESFDDYCQACCKSIKGHTVPCPNCSVVQYCSRECKKADKVHWKYTCHPSLPHIFDPLIQLMLRIVCRSFMPEIRSPVPSTSSSPSSKSTSTATSTSTSTSSSSSTPATEPEPEPEPEPSTSTAIVESPRPSKSKKSSQTPEGEQIYLTNYSSFRKLCHPPLASPDYILLSIYVGLCVRKMFYSLKNAQGVVIPKLGILIPHIFLHYHRLLINKLFIVSQEEPITLTTTPTSIVENADKIGYAIYPTVALVNHSCLPNGFLFFNGPTAIIRAIKTIGKDQELTICYGPSYASDTYPDRQQKLLDWYYFRCACEVCEAEATSPRISYKCPQCQSALVVNTDETHYCPTCGAEEVIRPGTSKEIAEAIEKMEAGRIIFESGDYDTAILMLSKSYNTMDDHLYRSNCNLIKARGYLADCLAAMRHYLMASKLIAVNVNVTGEIYGWDSVEYVTIMIYYCHLLYKDLDEIMEDGDKPSVREKGDKIMVLINEQIDRIKRLTKIANPTDKPLKVFTHEMKTLKEMKEKVQNLLTQADSSPDSS